MGKAHNLKGVKINRLTGIKRVPKDEKNSYWLFLCDCGKKKIIVANSVKRGITKSCGCFHKERAVQSNVRHGFIHRFKKNDRNPRFYSIWSGMRNRCQNKNNHSYFQYGANGITVSEDWQSFENFYQDMWDKYKTFSKRNTIKNTSLDRIDNSLGYSKENCRWATSKMQTRNKTNNSTYLINGKNVCITEIIEKFKLNRSRFYRRKKKGMTIDEILSDKTVYEFK